MVKVALRGRGPKGFLLINLYLGVGAPRGWLGVLGKGPQITLGGRVPNNEVFA